mgnify:FL=1
MKLATGITLKEYLGEINEIVYKNTYRGFADWRNCGRLSMDMCNLLDDATEVLTSEKRFKDLFKIACTAYLKWSDTPKDDSNGETQGFCITVDNMWQKVYDSQDESINHKAMIDWFEDVLRKRRVLD